MNGYFIIYVFNIGINSSVLVYMKIKQAAFFKKKKNLYLALFIILLEFSLVIFILFEREESESSCTCWFTLQMLTHPGMDQEEARAQRWIQVTCPSGRCSFPSRLLAPRMRIRKKLEWKEEGPDFDQTIQQGVQLSQVVI